MLVSRLVSFLKRTPSSQLSSSAVEELKTKAWGRRVVCGALIAITGGVALSALDDLAIYYGCSRAVPTLDKNPWPVLVYILHFIKPIVRGPCYNASLAVAHKRHSVSCTFPFSGPQGSGIFQLKAVRNGEDAWFSLRPHDWDILIMEALVHVPSNDEKQKTFRISLSDNLPPPVCVACTDCRSPAAVASGEDV